MSGSRRGGGVAAVCVVALVLAACGTQVDDEPSITVGPTVPTEATQSEPTGDPSEGEAIAPTATPPAVTDAPTTQDATGQETSGAPADTTTSEATGNAAETTGPTGGTDAATGGQTSGNPTETTPTATDTDPGEADGADLPGSLPAFVPPGDLLTQDPTGAVQLFADDVRVGLQDGYDRVVLDLSGTGQVGWWAAYTDAPALPGSGIPVDLAGPAILLVTAQGMAYPEPDNPVYDDGSLLVSAGGLQVVTEVLRDVPFEGGVSVYVGVREEAPFRVFRLSNPERLVIDIQH